MPPPPPLPANTWTTRGTTGPVSPSHSASPTAAAAAAETAAETVAVAEAEADAEAEAEAESEDVRQRLPSPGLSSAAPHIMTHRSLGCAGRSYAPATTAVSCAAIAALSHSLSSAPIINAGMVMSLASSLPSSGSPILQSLSSSHIEHTMTATAPARWQLRTLTVKGQRPRSTTATHPRTLCV